MKTSRRNLIVGAGAASLAYTVPTILVPRSSRAQSNEIKFMARGDQAIFNVFRRLNEEFQATDPGVTVNIEEVPADWHQLFQLQIASGEAPDCLFQDAGDILTDVRAGALEPIDDLIDGDSRFDRSAYFEQAFTGSMHDGQTYGLPYDGGSYALYYNKDLFDAEGLEYPSPDVPLNFEQVVEIATRLTKDRDGNSPDSDDFNPQRITQVGFHPALTDTWSSPWLAWWSMGVEVIDADGKVNLTDPVAIEAAQKLSDLHNLHHVATGPNLQNDAISFLSGNVAMVHDGVWSSVRYREATFQWDVAPTFSVDAPVTTGRYSPLSITSMSENKEAAFQWISFCCGEEGQRIVAELGQAVPPVRAIAESDAFLNPDSLPVNKQVFIDGLSDETYRMPGDIAGAAFAGYPREWGNLFTPFWTAALRGERSIEDAFTEAEPILQELLDTGRTN